MDNNILTKIKIQNPLKNRFSKITEDLYWARIPLPFKLDHVNVYAINSNEGLVIISPQHFLVNLLSIPVSLITKPSLLLIA